MGEAVSYQLSAVSQTEGVSVAPQHPPNRDATVRERTKVRWRVVLERAGATPHSVRIALAGRFARLTRMANNIQTTRRRNAADSAMAGLVMAALAVGLSAGCQRDTRLAGRALRNPTVQTVTQYGVTLDQQADPVDVAYVALRAVREDVQAAGSAERDKALDVQFSVCAPQAIGRNNARRLKPEEHLYNVVHQWAPTVSHYAADLPTDHAEARDRLVVLGEPAEGEPDHDERVVLMEAADPGGDPHAQVVVAVYLTREQGYWRVIHLGFAVPYRSMPDTVKPVGRGVPATRVPDPAPEDDA